MLYKPINKYITYINLKPPCKLVAKTEFITEFSNPE